MSETDQWFERERLHRAAADGDLEEVRRLIDAGYELDLFDDISYTPLHYAAKHGYVDVMQVLLSAGACVDARDEDRIGDTPLGAVSSNCSLTVAEILICAGADPEAPGWMQLTPLHHASARKRPEGAAVFELLSAAVKRKKT